MSTVWCDEKNSKYEKVVTRRVPFFGDLIPLVAPPLQWSRPAMSVPVCLSALFVRSHFSGTKLSKHQNSTKSSARVACGRGSVLHQRRCECDMLCTSGLVDGVMFAHNGQARAVMQIGPLLGDSPGATQI